MTNNRIVVASLGAWLLFVPLIIWTPLLYLLDFINALGFTFGAAVLWRYAPGAFWALCMIARGEPIGRGAMLVLGIVQTWMAMVGRTLVIWRWRWLSEPIGGLDSIPMSTVAWLIIAGGACHLAASAMPDDHVERPKMSARLLWGALMAGLILGAAIACGRWAIA